MHRKFVLTALALPLLVAACGSGPTGPQTTAVGVRFAVPQQQISRSVSTTASTSALLSPAASGVTVTRGGNTLVITEVKMTLEDIDLETATKSPDIEIEGPVLVRLNLTGNGITSPIQAHVPPGAYSLISFDISVPDGGDPAQVRYLLENPDMRGVSLRIRGTYNGQPFDFALDLRGDQEIPINPPLVVLEGQTGLDVVIQFDVASWFVRPNGTLMDPRMICSPDNDNDPPGCSPVDRTTVEQNIERSIQSYSDD